MKLSFTWCKIATAALLVGLYSPNVAAIELLAQGTDDFFHWAVRCYELKGEEGLEACNRAIAINSNNASVYTNRGLRRYELGDNQGAIEDYTQAIRINPNLAPAYNNRGNVRDNLGDYQGAIEDYTQAIRINLNFAQAYYNRGISHNQLGDREAALADWRKAAELYQQQGNIEWYQRSLDLIRKF